MYMKFKSRIDINVEYIHVSIFFWTEQSEQFLHFRHFRCQVSHLMSSQ